MKLGLNSFQSLRFIKKSVFIRIDLRSERNRRLSLAALSFEKYLTGVKNYEIGRIDRFIYRNRNLLAAFSSAK